MFGVGVSWVRLPFVFASWIAGYGGVLGRDGFHLVETCGGISWWINLA